MLSSQVPRSTNFDSLPAAERARMYLDEYERLMDEEFEQCSPRRSKIDTCVLQYAAACADAARADQLATLARRED